MNPIQTFCPNTACPARGKIDQGTIGVHSQKERRYICHVCGKTFAATTGTIFYRRRTAETEITDMITLLGHGCPPSAITATYGYHEQTVRAWAEAAGRHGEAIQQAEVLQPRDLGQVQADELRVKTQCGIVWMAMAMQVPSRLWLGGVISTRRDQHLITRLTLLIAACAILAPLLLVVDGLSTYVQAFRSVFRLRQPTGGRGAPRKVPWPELVIGQVVKQRERMRVVGVQRRLIQGATATMERLLEQTRGCLVLNTAYIERLNGTFRARLAPLARRTHHLSHRKELLHAGMYLVGAMYNFCSNHTSLTLDDGSERTPAMAAGITDHQWSMRELLWYRVRPPQWEPPKHRGRRSKTEQALIDRWCPV